MSKTIAEVCRLLDEAILDQEHALGALEETLKPVLGPDSPVTGCTPIDTEAPMAQFLERAMLRIADTNRNIRNLHARVQL